MSERGRTDWEEAVVTARDTGAPPPALVITLHDPDGTPSAELVIERGVRIILGASSEHFSDGSIGSEITVERMTVPPWAPSLADGRL